MQKAFLSMQKVFLSMQEPFLSIQKAFLSMQEPFLSIQKARQHMFNIRIPIRTIERITFSFFTALFIAVPLLTHSHNILPGYGHMSRISCALVSNC